MHILRSTNIEGHFGHYNKNTVPNMENDDVLYVVDLLEDDEDDSVYGISNDEEEEDDEAADIPNVGEWTSNIVVEGW